MFQNVLNRYFSTLGATLSKSFTRYVSAVISACSFSTHEIARHASKETGKDFNTSEKGLNYLLSNEKFQIDDAYWRCHIRMIFDLMREQDLIKDSEKIYIQVDFTSSKDDFLILAASTIVGNRSIPLYFTMRQYPKRKNQYDQKKMELAFLKGLRHLLSEKYAYVIVADRGFCNKRFIEACETTGFDYLIRGNDALKIDIQDKKDILKQFGLEDGTYDATAVNWEKNLNIHRVSNEKGQWYLFTNLTNLNSMQAGEAYARRFKIEKCFQDLKSSGFDMEKTKIRKYSKFKRLLAMVMISHALLVFLGHLIVVKVPHFLKNSALLASVILAYFRSQESLIPYLKQEKSSSL
jgi:hypothetical protein